MANAITMNSLVSLVVLLVSGAALVCCGQRFCEDGRLKAKDLASRSQLANLSKHLANSGCPAQLHAAIRDLNRLVNTKDVTGSQCSQDSADRVRDFYFKYVHKRADALSGPIRNFFLAYAMLLSETCRHRMMNYLYDVQFVLEREDFNQINWLVGRKGPMSELINEQWGYEKVVLPKPLAKLNQINSERVFVETGAAAQVKHLQAVCQRRFKPVYDKLIMPLISLAEMGFNFKGRDLTDLVHQEDRYVYKWFRIVLLCEVMSSIVVFKPKVPVREPRRIKILSSAEVERLDQADKVQLKPSEFPAIVPVEFKPNKIELRLPELIWDENYPELQSAIRQHHVSSSEDPKRFNRLRRLFSTAKRSTKKKALAIAVRNLPHGHANTPEKDDLLDKLIELQLDGVVLTDPEVHDYFIQYPDELDTRLSGHSKKSKFVLGALGLAFLGIFLFGVSAG